MLLLAVMLMLPASGAVSAESSRPNVILIVVDAMRPDHLGCYGYQRPTSPNMDLLAERSVKFETAITQAPWTKGAFSSIFTSLYPFQHSVTDWESVMPDSQVTLPEILKEHGYDTRCVINMIGLAGRFGVLSGFDEIVERGNKYRDAAETTDMAIRMMRESSGPFFLVVHYFDTHEPYRPPVNYVDMIRHESDPDPFSRRRRKPGGSGEHEESGESRLVPSDDEILNDMLLYDGCIRYVDNEIGRILSFIDDAGLEENTFLVVTADHGEAFWEHGIAGHGANVYDEAIRVPLIVHYPEAMAMTGRVEEQVAHVDIMPTILEFLGIEDDHHREGTELRSLIETGRRIRRGDTFLPRSATLCECTVRRAPGTKCIRTEERKLILEPTTSLVELFNLKDDPGETTNLWNTRGEVGNSMIRKMFEIPMASLHGWRIAFIGRDESTVFSAEVSLPSGGRFSSIERFTRQQTLTFDVSEDSTLIHLDAKPDGLDFVLVNTLPKDSPLRFTIKAAGEDIPGDANVGESGHLPIAGSFTLDTVEASGLPVSFQAARNSRLPGVHIWWLMGDEIVGRGSVTDLTPEEIRRLKALGYLN
jgi:arylsulfatase A-like enzyme